MKNFPRLLRLRFLLGVLATALLFGGACNCEDEPDPRQDTGEVDAPDDTDDGDDPTDIPDDQARLQFIHDAADPAASDIDVYFDDDLLIDDFSFRTATPYIDIAPDDYSVAIAEAGSAGADEAVALFEEVEFRENRRYLMIASGLLDPGGFDDNPDGEDTEIALYVFEDALESSEDEGADELVLFHGVTDAPSLDLVADNAMAVVTDLTYGGFTDGYLSIPAGVSVFDLLNTESQNRLASYQTPSLEGGDTWVGLASGFLDAAQNEDAPFELLLYPTPVDGDRLDPIVLDEAARLQFVHDSIDPGVSPADLYADDRRLDDGLDYREATPFLTIPSGVSTDIAVVEADTSGPDDPIASQSIEFAPAQTAIAAVSGVTVPDSFPDNPEGVDTEVDLYVDDARETGSETDAVDLTAFHGILDAPSIIAGLETDDGEVRLADELGYTEFGDYAVVSGDPDATLSISPADAPEERIADVEIDTENFVGDGALVVVSGLLDEDDEVGNAPPVAAVVVGPDGETTVVEAD